jgi:hypothetical protein
MKLGRRARNDAAVPHHPSARQIGGYWVWPLVDTLKTALYVSLRIALSRREI